MPSNSAAMIAEARKHPGWRSLLSIPFRGVVRVAQLLAIMVTPHRFRTKRNLWPYAGLAVVTRSSADREFASLNRNHNPLLKSIFKGAANAAAVKAGPLQDLYEACVARGTKPELAKVTLARKIASIALRLWKKGELWNPDKLTLAARFAFFGCTNGYRTARGKRYEPFRMLEFTLFKELYEFVEVIPYFIHQLLAQGTSFSDDWIFPDHFSLP